MRGKRQAVANKGCSGGRHNQGDTPRAHTQQTSVTVTWNFPMTAGSTACVVNQVLHAITLTVLATASILHAPGGKRSSPREGAASGGEVTRPYDGKGAAFRDVAIVTCSGSAKLESTAVDQAPRAITAVDQAPSYHPHEAFYRLSATWVRNPRGQITFYMYPNPNPNYLLHAYTVRTVLYTIQSGGRNGAKSGNRSGGGSGSAGGPGNTAEAGTKRVLEPRAAG